ncbi:MAG: hypothetical protein Satyrvirus3_3 [Satyrvirus sp.]|uniref:U-box domain-containing protein n=1 Tax=Satyrvirus sp. TaxID=2487771 RepID=A0A3G5AD24_9VIRU|nr:MAG: hypothetical protein Satyrvirus3_3 [Satyrvirus sp.]
MEKIVGSSKGLEEYIHCPINKMIMYDPVVAGDGIIYERFSIEDWFKNNSTSPITREKIQKDTFPVVAIKSIISEYLEKNPDEKQNQYIPSYNHLDNVAIVKYYISTNKLNRLLDYKNFSMEAFHKPLNLMNKKNTAKSKPNPKQEFFDANFENIFESKNDKLIMHIIDNVDDLEYQYGGKRMVHDVCKYCGPDIIKYLVNKNVDMTCADKIGNTSLHYLCLNKLLTLEILEIVLKSKVKLQCTNRDGNTPMHLLCENNKVSIEIFKFVTDKIKNFNIKNKAQECIVHILCRGNKLEEIKYLAEKGIDLEIPGPDGWRPIHYASYASNVGNKELFTYLVEKNVNLECETSKKYTPLAIVCHKIKIDLLKCLINKGVKMVQPEYNHIDVPRVIAYNRYDDDSDYSSDDDY